MVKMAGTVEAIERFRAIADPNRYQEVARSHKDELTQQGERILLQHELTSSDPALTKQEKRSVIENLERSMQSVLNRIEEIDEILASYKTGQQAGMNRRVRRQLMKKGSLAKAAGASSAKPKLGVVPVEDEDVDGSDELDDQYDLED